MCTYKIAYVWRLSPHVSPSHSFHPSLLPSHTPSLSPSLPRGLGYIWTVFINLCISLETETNACDDCVRVCLFACMCMHVCSESMFGECVLMCVCVSRYWNSSTHPCSPGSPTLNSSVGPLVLLRLRVLVRFAVLHSDAT